MLTLKRRSLCPMLLALASCSSIGPATVQRDRLDYSDALGEAAKRETLLNIVKLCYADVPNLVSVSQLVAGYTLQGTVNLNSAFFREQFQLSNDVGFGVGGLFSDHPTLTYTPIKGDDFARVMLTPLSPVNVIAMVAAGAPADAVLGLGVESINGTRNWSINAQADAGDDRRFEQILELIDELHAADQLNFHFEGHSTNDTAYLLLDRQSAATDPRAKMLLGLLGLEPTLRSIPIRFGFDTSSSEILVDTRSLIQILKTFGAGIEVPASDVSAGRTYPARRAGGAQGVLPWVTVRSSDLRPSGAYAAVEYRNIWYHVDDDDLHSNEVFTVLMLILNLVENVDSGQNPVITIPSG